MCLFLGVIYTLLYFRQPIMSTYYVAMYSNSSLSWPNVIQDINIPTYEANQMKLPNRNTSRNRKLPITGSNDFLW